MTEVSTVDVQPRSGAAIEQRTAWRDVVPTIRKLFDRLYAPGAINRDVHGHNFIVYRDGDRDGVTMVVGVEHSLPAGTDPDIRLAQIPAGRAATAPHFGDYGAMRPTYVAIEAYVAANNLKRIDRSLELYGDWYDDPAKVRTDIYLYLA